MALPPPRTQQERTPAFCAACGKPLRFRPSALGDRFDVYTGQPALTRGWLQCPDYRDHQRGDNGHSSFEAEQRVTSEFRD